MKYESLTFSVSLGLRTVVPLNFTQHVFDVSLPISKQYRWLHGSKKVMSKEVRTPCRCLWIKQHLREFARHDAF